MAKHPFRPSGIAPAAATTFTEITHDKNGNEIRTTTQIKTDGSRIKNVQIRSRLAALHEPSFVESSRKTTEANAKLQAQLAAQITAISNGTGIPNGFTHPFKVGDRVELTAAYYGNHGVGDTGVILNFVTPPVVEVKFDMTSNVHKVNIGNLKLSTKHLFLKGDKVQFTGSYQSPVLQPGSVGIFQAYSAVPLGGIRQCVVKFGFALASVDVASICPLATTGSAALRQKCLKKGTRVILIEDQHTIESGVIPKGTKGRVVHSDPGVTSEVDEVKFSTGVQCHVQRDKLCLL